MGEGWEARSGGRGSSRDASTFSMTWYSEFMKHGPDFAVSFPNVDRTDQLSNTNTQKNEAGLNSADFLQYDNSFFLLLKKSTYIKF